MPARRLDLARLPALGPWFAELGVDDPRALTAISIGAAALEAEQLIQGGGKPRRLVIPVYGAAACGYDLKRLGEVLRDLLLFALVYDFEIEFVNTGFQVTLLTPDTPAGTSPSQLCLFSGGVDSFAGILMAAEREPRTEAIFCAHRDQARLIHIVHALISRLSRLGIPTVTVPVPPMGSSGYVQLRGYLYVLAAGLRLAVTGASKLVVTECGPTMFQPRFSAVDAVTMTTHPEVLRHAGRTLDLVLGRAITIHTPFSELTKAEVVALAPNHSALRATHSCISQRFGDHDGTCYGCVVRRLAFVATGYRDVSYRRNPLTDERANAGNLLTLLTFCHDLLTNYSMMEDHERAMIDRFGKKRLFQRFALDNLAAVHRLATRKSRLRRDVRRIYDFAREAVGEDELENRLDVLRKTAVRPDWSQQVRQS